MQAWGTNNKAELGDGTQQARNHPVPVVGLTDVKEVAIGNAHSMALLYDGTVWTWGAAEFGERGNREHGFERVARDNEPQWFVPRDRPTQVPGLSGVKQIASGGTRDFALLNDGEVMAWGDDRGGDLGVQESGETEKCLGETHAITPIPCSTIPRTVMVSPGVPLSGVERIGVGDESAYAVRSGGEEVLAWGENFRGQLGNGTTTPSPMPVRASFEPGSPILEIAGGSMHALARLANGQVYAWGADNAGQLGFTAGQEPWERCGEGAACSTIPQQVFALSHVVQIAPAENTSLVLVRTGRTPPGSSTRSAPPATTNCSGSGTCPTKKPPPRRRSRASVRCARSASARPPPRCCWKASRDRRRCSAPRLCSRGSRWPGTCPAASLQAPLPPNRNARIQLARRSRPAIPPAKSS